MFRTSRILMFCGFALGLWPATASAQFQPGSFIPGNPLYPLTPFRYTPSFAVPANGIYGRMNVYVPNGLPNPLARAAPFYSWYAPPGARVGSTLPWMGGGATSGYMSGGTRPNYALQYAQQEYERTHGDQKVRDMIAGQWGYEKGAEPAVVVAKNGGPAADELMKALAGANDAATYSGESLNVILAAIVAAEAKGAKGPSAFLPPEELNAVRFAGPPAADAINLIRQAGKLPFPVAFADPTLKAVRDELERDFAAAAAPLRDGKPADVTKLAKLAFTFGKTQKAAPEVIRKLPFDDATASRRFLNQFERAVGAMRAANAHTLVIPSWATDGASVADLVKHMTKQKLLFGPAPTGGEDSYVTLHKGLATYLFVLTQPKK